MALFLNYNLIILIFFSSSFYFFIFFLVWDPPSKESFDNPRAKYLRYEKLRITSQEKCPCDLRGSAHAANNKFGFGCKMKKKPNYQFCVSKYEADNQKVGLFFNILELLILGTELILNVENGFANLQC